MDYPSKTLTTVTIVITILIFSTITPTVAYASSFGKEDSVRKALSYLKSFQDVDGSIGGFSVSAWVVMALVAAGENPHEWKVNQTTPSIVDYLKDNVDKLGNVPTDYERFILAMVAAGENPKNISGVNCVEKLKGFYEKGQIGSLQALNDDFWGLLALIAAGEDPNSEVVQNTKKYILENQNVDGGWSFIVNGSSDVDDTSAAIMALVAAGEDPNSESIVKALNFLKRSQNMDGGFSWGPDSNISNSISTAWVVMALVAVGEDPTSETWTVNGNNPIKFLLDLQNEDGSFKWTANINFGSLYATACVLQALMGVPYPVKPKQKISTVETESSTSLIYVPNPFNISCEEWCLNSNLDPRVYVRVEGSTTTLFEGYVNVAGNFTVNISKWHGNTLKNSYVVSSTTALGALHATGLSYGVTDEYLTSFGDLYLWKIGDEQAVYGNWSTGWSFMVNYESPLGCAFLSPTLKDDDFVLFFWVTRIPLKVELSKTTVQTYEEFTVTVKKYQNWNWSPAENVTVHVNGKSYQTNSEGKVFVSISKSGYYSVWAEKTGNNVYIPSRKVTVRVVIPPDITELIKIRKEAEKILSSKGNVTEAHALLVKKGVITEETTPASGLFAKRLKEIYGEFLEKYPCFEGRVQLLKALGIKTVKIKPTTQQSKVTTVSKVEEIGKILCEVKKTLKEKGVDESYQILVKNGIISDEIPPIPKSSSVYQKLTRLYGEFLEKYPSVEGRVQLLKALGIKTVG